MRNQHDPPADARSLLQRVDDLCLRFEDEWQAGKRPQAGAYLAGLPADERAELLPELLLLEWDYRSRGGDSFDLGEYEQRFAPQVALVAAAWRRWQEQCASAGTASYRGPPAAPAGAPQDSAPFTLPGYEKVELLSKGGMGEVYRAFDSRLKRWVALKRARLEQSAPDVLARFRLEAEALARLSHPHIVKVHGYHESGGQPIFEMELVPGGNLDQRLGRQPIAPREAARLVAILAWAVHAAHEKGIVHRDLKPANVLMDDLVPGSSGNVLGGFPKVSDFGLAALEGALPGQTLAGTVLGTPDYMSPEQAAGRKSEVGPASDTWALGVIFYRCLTGALPFKGESVPQTLDRVKTGQFRTPREQRLEVPADFEQACLACLRQAPGERPTAKELAQRLERLAGVAPSRRWAWWAAAAVAAGVLALAGWWIGQRPNGGPGGQAGLEKKPP